jgi:hypothetical protein
MRRDIYAAIRRNLIHPTVTLSRHDVVNILAAILAGQIQILQDDARKHLPE